MDDRLAERLRDALARAEAVAPGGAPGAGLGPGDLERVARDRGEAADRRRAALAEFVRRNRVERAAGDLVRDLIDDPEEAVALEAIRAALPFDERVMGRLRALLGDERPAFRAEAARALGRRKDRKAIPTFLAWFRRGDRARRALALEALGWALYPQEWRAFLASAWEAGPIDDREQLALAEGLLRLGDRRGLGGLEELAGHEDGEIAARARAALRDGESL
jgi:HEAT repeat protein